MDQTLEVVSTQQQKMQTKPDRGSAIASLQSVVKNYEEQRALDGISFQLYAGEVVALLGANGAGKTTSVRLLLGLTTPDAGTVQLFGDDPRTRRARMRVGAMLQVGAGAVPEKLRVHEHIDLFRSYYPKPLPEKEIIEIAGLEGIVNRPFGKLSGGQKQRVLFALALAGDPDLLFLDEPTVGLDVEARRALWDQIRQLPARGKTVLLTTHYLEEADASASRILVVQQGKVIREGTPAEVKATQRVRHIRCETSLDFSFLRTLPTVSLVSRDGAYTVIAAEDPDAVVRQMILHDSQLHGLEIKSAGLEDAFLALINNKQEKQAKA